VRNWIEDAPLDVPHLVILGVAQDAGHPQAGCTKACCAAAHADPSARHRVASLGIVDGEHRVLIEATPDLPSQLHDLSPSGRLDGVLLTHAHIGHYAGLVHLGREAMGADSIPVWAMPRMRAFLAADRPWSLLVDQGHIALRDLAEGETVQVTPNVTVTPFVVPHRDEISETVGFRIAGPAFRVAFLPDIDKWERWDAAGGSIESLLEAVDVALVDGTFFANGEIPRDMAQIPHPFVSESLERFAELPPALRQRIWFTHFNHSNPLLTDPAARRTVREAGFGLAEGGRRIALGPTAVPGE
jgi:pyrroloquinoline quinone biosynthesis protein B